MRNSWENARTEFNHDWLKNRFLLSLDGAINFIDEKAEDTFFEKIFATQILSEWEAKRENANKIILGFNQEASPKALFSRPPLSQFDKNTKKWLSNLVHNLWLTRYGVESQINSALKILDETDKSYFKLQECLNENIKSDSAKNLRRCRSELGEFRQKCQKLADVMTLFQGGGKVV